MLEIERFFHNLFKNTDKFKRPVSKLRVIKMNAKIIYKPIWASFLMWAVDLKIVRFVYSLRAFIMLFDAGFRISYSENSNMNWGMFRFYWKNKVIREMPDIDCVDGTYVTVQDGHVERLQ